MLIPWLTREVTDFTEEFFTALLTCQFKESLRVHVIKTKYITSQWRPVVIFRITKAEFQGYSGTNSIFRKLRNWFQPIPTSFSAKKKIENP